MNNVSIIRNAYAAFARGDVPAVLGVLDPQVQWTEAEGFPYGGTYIGPEAVLNGVLVKLATEWDAYRADANEFLCTQSAFEVADSAVQLLGGKGLQKGYLVEKLFRDARAALIEDGSNDILALAGARKILREPAQ